MREGDLVRISGKIRNKIKDVEANLVGTVVGLANLNNGSIVEILPSGLNANFNNESIVEVLLGDGSIYRVKTKHVHLLNEETANVKAS